MDEFKEKSDDKKLLAKEDDDLFNSNLLDLLPDQKHESSLLVRPLRSTDYENGFLQLLGQLTEVGDVSKDQYLSCFSKMKQAGGYYVVIVEDLNSGKVIGSATLVVEQKFIHNCSLKGRVEDVVVNSNYRGKQLGKLLVSTITKLAKSLHCYKLSLDCRDRLVQFYESLGYVKEPDIENLTHKTGNYKQFDVFVTMLQSGLLKTSDCVTLDLLTFDDLEMLRARRSEVTPSSTIGSKGSNRRYLILTYTAEFDRIHYPLPLEYCGLPDPSILQATIRRLQAEIERFRSSGTNGNLQKRIDQLTLANRQLVEENRKLMTEKGPRRLASAIKTLENNVAKERVSFRAQIQKLRIENASLSLKVRQLTETTSRKSVDCHFAQRKRTPTPTRSLQGRRSLVRKIRSRSPSLSGRFKTASSLSPGSSVESLRSRVSPRPRLTRSYHFGAKEIDFGNLESRIQALQKMLKDGINLN